MQEQITRGVFMRIKEGFTLKNIHGQNFIVYTGTDLTDFTRSISLSATSSFLWEKLCEGEKSNEELFKLLLSHFFFTQKHLFSPFVFNFRNVGCGRHF